MLISWVLTVSLIISVINVIILSQRKSANFSINYLIFWINCHLILKSSLVYIAGYVSKKGLEIKDDTFCYYNMYGNYTSSLDRGGFENTWWYLLFCYVDAENLCRYTLASLFFDIGYAYYGSANIERRHCNVLSNIYFNNYCELHTPGSDKEPQLKLLKLSCYRVYTSCLNKISLTFA